jgi:transposase
LAVHPLRHWLDGKITGHVFICYLSLVLLTTFRILMQKTQLQSLESVTAERALKELQAIYMIEYRMKSKGDHVAKTLQKPFYKVITLSNLQKKIFHALCPNIDL